MEGKTLAERLLMVQSKLKAPKSQFNSFGKYHYRNCEDILEAVKPLLLENEVMLAITDEIVLIGERYYAKATVKLYDKDYANSIEVSAYAREGENKKGMDDAQLTGAASSYARKYALNGLFLIDDSKDADFAPEDTNTPQPQKNAQNVPKNTQTVAPQPTREQIIKKCLEYTKILEYDETEMADYLNNGTNDDVIERFTMLQKQIKARA